MNAETQFKDQLRLAGERVTSPRLGLFRILLRQSPLSMPALIEQGQLAHIDPATTYRTVDLLLRLGLIQEVGLGRNRLLEPSDRYQGHHHHFTCLVCGQIYDVDDAPLEASLRALGSQLKFDIRTHQLEVTGVCQACQKA